MFKKYLNFESFITVIYPTLLVLTIVLFACLTAPLFIIPIMVALANIVFIATNSLSYYINDDEFKQTYNMTFKKRILYAIITIAINMVIAIILVSTIGYQSIIALK